MYMLVFMKSKSPVVIETNLAFAIPYWEKRKLQEPSIHWEIKETL